MRFPAAFLDAARSIAMADYLTFSLGAERFFAAHANAGGLAASVERLVGWARLVDEIVENAGVDSFFAEVDAQSLFRRDVMRAAVADLLVALEQVPLHRFEAGAFEELSASQVRDHAKAFLAGAERLVTACDGVRAPAWRRRWWGDASSAPVIDATRLPFPMKPRDAKDGAVLVNVSNTVERLELRTSGHATLALEIDRAALSGVLTTYVRFDRAALGGAADLNEADVELALFDWTGRQLADLPKPPSRARPPMICAFCGKSNTEVSRLIAGPACYICNECVRLCADIIAE